MMIELLPDFCISGRPLPAVEGAIIHYFSARNIDKPNEFDLVACRDLFLDLNRTQAHRERYMLDKPWPKGRLYASAHYLIGRQGEIQQLVALDKQAYHAGASELNNRDDCNTWTIGIELVGHQHSGFTESQYTALASLLVELRAEHSIPLDAIAGHDSVRWAAIQKGGAKHLKAKYDPSGRKNGKGDNFDWSKLYQYLNDLETNQEVSNGNL